MEDYTIPDSDDENDALLNNNLNNDEKTPYDPLMVPKPNDIQTVDDALGIIPVGGFHIQLLLLCGMGNFVEALEVAMMSVVFPLLKSEWHLANWQLALEGAGTVLGMLLGALVLGRMSDIYGRRIVFQLSLFVSSLFGFLSAVSPNIYVFIIFRFLMGIGYGGNIVVDCVLLAEMVPVSVRGYFLSTLDIFFGFGALFIVGISWLVMPHYGWRMVIAIASLPAFLMLFLRRSIPESPRFLLMNGRVEEARLVLIKIARDSKASLDIINVLKRADLSPEHYQVEDDYSLNRYSDLFYSPVMGSLTRILLIIWFFNALAMTVSGWIPLYLSEHKNLLTGSAQDIAYAAAFAGAVGGLIGGFTLAIVVTFVDRRILLRFLFFFAAIAVYCMGLCKTSDQMIFVLGVTGALMGAATTMLYIYTPEVYPTQIRTTALGLCSSAHRFAPVLGHFGAAMLVNLPLRTVTFLFASLYIIPLIASLGLTHDTRVMNLGAIYYEQVIMVDKHEK